MEQARRIFAAGIQFANQVQCESEWWIFWGRVAGGLNRNQQIDVFQRISANLLPRAGKKPQRLNSSLLREMWRTACSLELLPGQTKTDLGEALIKRVKAGDYRETELWCLARLGARQLFYGANNHVLPPMTAARWVEALLAVPKAAETIAALARHTGDTARDVPPVTMDLVRRRSLGNAGDGAGPGHPRRRGVQRAGTRPDLRRRAALRPRLRRSGRVTTS